MKIDIDQIPEKGLTLTESCQPADLDLGRADIKITDPINLSAQISKGINNISINLKIEGIMHLNCNRCLEQYSSPLSREIKLNFPTESKKEIDRYGQDPQHELLPGHPLKPLCRPDCLGLCATCGQNLNKERCNHGSTKKTSFKSKTR